MFCPSLVTLETQSFSRVYYNFFCLITFFIIQYGVVSPGAMIFRLSFFNNCFLDLHVFFNHAVDCEVLFNMRAAACPVNIFYFRNGIYCLILCFYEKTVFAVFDKFGHAPPVTCDHRGAACHRFYNGQAEGFIEIYGVEKCGCLAEQPVALNRVGTAGIDNIVVIQVWFDVLVIVGFILDLSLIHISEPTRLQV